MINNEYTSPVVYSSSRRHGRPPVHITGKVEDCKADLKRRFGTREPVAHRMLQRMSMDLKIPLDKSADILRLGLSALDHLADDAAFQYENTDGTPEE